MTATQRLPRLLLAAVFAAFGVVAGIDSAGKVAERINPTLAGRLALNPGKALGAQADLALAISVENKRSGGQQIGSLAREALRHTPILPNALRDIGYAVAAQDANLGRRLMLTAVGHQSVILEAIMAGAKDFLVKPVEPERLLTVVGRLLAP